MKRLFTLWALQAAFLLVMPSCGNKKAGEARKLLEEARTLQAAKGGNKGDTLQKARVLLRKALSLDPGLDEAKGLLARVLLQQGEYGKALSLVEQIPFPSQEDSLTLALSAAFLYKLKGDSSLAEKALLGLQGAGDSAGPQARFQVARALLEGPGGDGHSKGIRLLEELVRAEKHPPSRWEAMLGVALFRAGMKKDAATHLRKALEDPDLPERETIAKLLEACK